MSDFKKLGFYDEDVKLSWSPSTSGSAGTVEPDEVYVIRWEMPSGNRFYDQGSGILGAFLTRHKAMQALEAMEVPCWKSATLNHWRFYKINDYEEEGVAKPATKDGIKWELYGPDGELASAGPNDEPSFFIEKFRLDRLSPWTTEVWI